MATAPLPGYALFAALLASAGLPIYIHAPKFYVDEYGVSLAALGAVLFGLRLFDVVQDPALGWLSERLRRVRGLAVGFGVALLAVSMVALFAVTPPVAPLLWFGLTLTGLFTAFSFLTITFYAQGVARAARMGRGGHVRLAAWRETGALLGVSAAAVAPTALVAVSEAPFAAFAVGFVGLALLAVWAMRREWGMARAPEPSNLRAVLADPIARRLLLVALLNATPVAVTSTLFLFFVESRLAAPGWEGPLLLLFFLAAAASAPLWGRLAQRLGAKRTLLSGMVLSIVAFGFAATLGAGDLVPFAVICLASGAALGADMTLLPAIFAGRMAQIAPNAGQAFGLWSFVSKFTLAFAAVTLLPLLEAAGFRAGAENDASALVMLGVLYALVPCALKLMGIALLAAVPLKREETG
ncbi:MFS transporter [Rhodovulum adriaticum]|uniref:GPH family glycoside/pentoside/hexuronide:cation symporter n=1 Tax=Rhodovulum adriaticum TaxID=35804 RepID=A0A4R2NXZ9_RHOAD|nr:MFS transporter [Rhodovulum adriaticum]MBK1634318.1 sugar:cation symporter [Rhodovulum adriaticum]TCP27129.1 GPH family glycoside/pentoside/hexuronide:cation symporter [Rhodovulum adriaticum]